MASISASQIVHLNRDAAAGRAAVAQRDADRAAVADIRLQWLEGHGVPFGLVGGQPIADVAAVAALDAATQREAFVALACDYFTPHAFPRGTDLIEAFPALQAIPGFADVVADAWRKPPQLSVTGAQLEERGVDVVAAEVWERFENPAAWVLAADTRAGRQDRVFALGNRFHWLCDWFDRNSGGLTGTALGDGVSGIEAMLWMWANLDADSDQLAVAWAAMPYPLRLLVAAKVGQCSTCDSRRFADAILRLPRPGDGTNRR